MINPLTGGPAAGGVTKMKEDQWISNPIDRNVRNQNRMLGRTVLAKRLYSMLYQEGLNKENKIVKTINY